MVYKKKN